MSTKAKASEPAKDQPKDEAQTGFVKVPAEPKADPEDTGKPWGGQPDEPAPAPEQQPAPKSDPPKAPPSDRT